MWPVPNWPGIAPEKRTASAAPTRAETNESASELKRQGQVAGFEALYWNSNSFPGNIAPVDTEDVGYTGLLRRNQPATHATPYVNYAVWSRKSDDFGYYRTRRGGRASLDELEKATAVNSIIASH